MSSYTTTRTASETEASRPAPRGRAANIALWGAQIVLAALFAFSGISKLLPSLEVVAGFAQIGLGQWFRYFTGAVEVAGAIGLLIPRLSVLAALGLAGVMVGAVIIHLLVIPPAALAVVPALVGTVLVLIARARRPRTRGAQPVIDP